MEPLHTAPWLETPPAALSAVDPLPEDVEVAVVGGGLAGLSAAATLAEGGATVALLEARPLLAGGISGRAPGMVLAGLGEHPHRLIASVGLDEARAMHRFLAANRERVLSLCEAEARGSYAVAGMEGEDEELAEHGGALSELGVDSEALSADEVNARLSSQGFGRGRFVPADAAVDPLAPAVALVRKARAAGAALVPGVAVSGVDEDARGVAVHHAGGTLRAQAVIWAAGAALAKLDHWFADKVYPVRYQWSATAPVDPGRLPCPVTAQHGFSEWRQRPSGRVIAGGARFGSTHMEVGETDEDVVHGKIAHIQQANTQRFFPDLADVAFTHTWAAIATHSCDGLPILGPIPGRVALVACTGFHAFDHALAVEAGHVVASGLLTGSNPDLPRLFRTQRMV